MKTTVSDCCLDRTAFLIYVDLDPVPGTFHTPLSAFEVLGAIFEAAIPLYLPTVILVNDNLYKGENYPRRRVCFAMYVDLSPIPGTFHSKESAHNVIRNILDERIPHYNPIVSLGPAEIQPHNITEGNR